MQGAQMLGSFAYLIKLVLMLAENAVILVIHRGQSDPENEEKIMLINPASGFASGLHLGTQATKLHILQLLAYGRYGETPRLRGQQTKTTSPVQPSTGDLAGRLRSCIYLNVSICAIDWISCICMYHQLYFWLHSSKY